MKKVKGKQIMTILERESVSRDSRMDSSDSNSKLDDRETSDWVIVKKQRVTILVPAITVAKKSTTACHLQSLSQKPSSNGPQLPTACVTVPSVAKQDKSEPLAPIKAIEVAGKKAPALAISTLANQSAVDQKVEIENLRQMKISKSSKFPVLSQTSKIKRPRLSLGPSWSLPNRGINLNQGLRASNLERKIHKAGGLSEWLKSLGLDQFVNIFQGRSLNKYQLVSLTMEKLKDMGANAVGPRRKLIHAIDCVCQPYCFGPS